MQVVAHFDADTAGSAVGFQDPDWVRVRACVRACVYVCVRARARVPVLCGARSCEVCVSPKVTDAVNAELR